MSDKPVYQIDVAKNGAWFECTQEQFEEIKSSGAEFVDFRILYPASAYEALKKDRDMYKAVCEQWIEKTEWVQQDKSNLFFGSLGLHRADAMAKAIEALKAESEAQAKRIAELETPLTHRQISSACLSFRHDFGLLEPEQQAALFSEAKSWEACFQKERDIAASKNGDSK